MGKYYYEKSSQNIFRNQYPDIINVAFLNYSDGVVYNTHMHEYPELIFILNGKSEQIINNQRYSVKKGHLILMNKHTLHSELSSADDSTTVITCALDNVFLEGLEDNCIIPKASSPIIECVDYTEKIENLFKELYYDRNRNEVFCYQLAQLTVAKILYYISRLQDKTSESSNQTTSGLAKNVKLYIDENYNKEITLDHLSNLFFVSSFHLLHEMKKELGISPISYQINRRIGEAQRQLIHTDTPIEDISKAVGYESVSYFTRVFLKKTGYTPAKFRTIYKFKKSLTEE